MQNFKVENNTTNIHTALSEWRYIKEANNARNKIIKTILSSKIRRH